jgi:hypothetical protein
MEKCERIRFFEGAKLRFLSAAKSLQQLFCGFIFAIKYFSSTFVAEFEKRGISSVGRASRKPSGRSSVQKLVGGLAQLVERPESLREGHRFKN